MEMLAMLREKVGCGRSMDAMRGFSGIIPGLNSRCLCKK